MVDSAVYTSLAVWFVLTLALIAFSFYLWRRYKLPSAFWFFVYQAVTLCTAWLPFAARLALLALLKRDRSGGFWPFEMPIGSFIVASQDQRTDPARCLWMPRTAGRGRLHPPATGGAPAAAAGACEMGSQGAGPEQGTWPRDDSVSHPAYIGSDCLCRLAEDERVRPGALGASGRDLRWCASFSVLLHVPFGPGKRAADSSPPAGVELLAALGA